MGGKLDANDARTAAGQYLLKRLRTGTTILIAVSQSNGPIEVHREHQSDTDLAADAV